MPDAPNFRPPEPGHDTHWRPVADFRTALGAGAVVLSDTELLACAHHLPVFVTVGSFRVAVSACLEEALLMRPAVEPVTGRYTRDFSPLSLRALPFRLGHDDRLEVDTAHLTGDEPGSRPVFAAKGKLDPVVERVRTMLLRHRGGCARLAQAASALFAANLLVEVPVPTGSPDGEALRYFTIDMEAYSALRPLQIMGIGHDGCLPLDLAASIIFSRRLLRPRYQAVLTRRADVATGQLTPEGIDQLVRSVGQLDFHLDEGELIELQSFETADPATGIVVDEAAVRS